MRWSEGVAPGRTEVGSADVARDRLDGSKCRSHTSGASHWSWQNFADDAEQRGRSWRPWTGAQMLVGGHLGPIEQELQAATATDGGVRVIEGKRRVRKQA